MSGEAKKAKKETEKTLHCSYISFYSLVLSYTQNSDPYKVPNDQCPSRLKDLHIIPNAALRLQAIKDYSSNVPFHEAYSQGWIR